MGPCSTPIRAWGAAANEQAADDLADFEFMLYSEERSEAVQVRTRNKPGIREGGTKGGRGGLADEIRVLLPEGRRRE